MSEAHASLLPWVCSQGHVLGPWMRLLRKRSEGWVGAGPELAHCPEVSLSPHPPPITGLQFHSDQVRLAAARWEEGLGHAEGLS